MARMVNCVKLGREAEGLDLPPYPGELGKRIYENVSQEAWRMWLEHSKRIVNEYRLDLTSSRGTQILFEEAERFFFGEGSVAPPDYKPDHNDGYCIRCEGFAECTARHLRINRPTVIAQAPPAAASLETT